MRDMVEKAGIAARYHIASAATSREELGNPVYPPARRKLWEHGIDCAGHAARQLTRSDYDAYDYLVGMDSANRRNMQRICGGDPQGKISLLLDWVGKRPSKAGSVTAGSEACSGDVADPWYTGDFEATWRDVQRGCRALLEALETEETAGG